MNKIVKLLYKVRRAYYRHVLSNTKVYGKFKIHSATIFHSMNGGKIIIGDNVHLGYYPSPMFFDGSNYIDVRGCRGGGGNDVAISIGNGTCINNNFSIVAYKSSIRIGKNCLIGANFQAMSSDFHGLTIKDRNNHECIKSGEVVIGDNCFLGSNVTIMKGVTIGDGCVIGSGSVVTKSFPDNSLIGGNPARLLRVIQQDEGGM